MNNEMNKKEQGEEDDKREHLMYRELIHRYILR
jgi:hypothetical protein